MSKFIDKLKAQTSEKQQLTLKDLAKELAKAQKFRRLCRLLTDFNYLQVKLERLGVGALIDDYNLVQNHDIWKELRLIQKALYISGDTLAKDTSELAKKLTRLLATYQHLPWIKKLLKTAIQYLETATQYQGKPWLCLLSPTISSPVAQPLIRTLTGHTSSLTAVAVTPDGKKVISGGWDETIKIWDLVTGNLEKTLVDYNKSFHHQSVATLVVTSDGTKIISGHYDKTLKIWDLATGNLDKDFIGHSHEVMTVSITPDSKQVISGSSDKTIKIWDLEIGILEKTTSNHAESIQSIIITTDNNKLITSSRDNTLKLWNLEIENVETSHIDEIDYLGATALNFDSKKVIYIGNKEGENVNKEVVKILDLDTLEVEKSFQNHIIVEKLVIKLNFYKTIQEDPYNTRKVLERTEIKTISGNILVKNLKFFVYLLKGKLPNLEKTFLDNNSNIKSIVMTPNCKKIISGSQDATVKVWDLSKGNPPRTLSDHPRPMNPNSSEELVGLIYLIKTFFPTFFDFWDTTIKLWYLATVNSKKTSPIFSHDNSVNVVAVTPDGKKIISGSSDQTLKIWDLATEKLEKTLTDHSKSVNAVAVTPDSKKVISGSSDQTLKIWDLTTRQLQYTLTGHSKSVNAVVVTPDGKKIISGSDDNTVKVWDLDTGNCIATFTAEASITCVAVASDGVSIVAGDSSGNVHFLRLMGV